VEDTHRQPQRQVAPPFSFESDWIPTSLTPDSVPGEWARLSDAFLRLRREFGPQLAVSDLQRWLNAGWIEATALRNVGEAQRPIWQQRSLPREFWHMIKLTPALDRHGNESLRSTPVGVGRMPQAMASLSRGDGWYFFIQRAGVDSMLTGSSRELTRPAGVSDLMWGLLKTLAALEQEGALLGVKQKTLLDMVEGRYEKVSLRTLQAGLALYRKLKRDRRV
jgi:hypothetical protein